MRSGYKIGGKNSSSKWVGCSTSCLGTGKVICPSAHVHTSNNVEDLKILQWCCYLLLSIGCKGRPVTVNYVFWRTLSLCDFKSVTISSAYKIGHKVTTRLVSLAAVFWMSCNINIQKMIMRETTTRWGAVIYLLVLPKGGIHVLVFLVVVVIVVLYYYYLCSKLTVQDQQFFFYCRGGSPGRGGGVTPI